MNPKRWRRSVRREDEETMKISTMLEISLLLALGSTMAGCDPRAVPPSGTAHDIPCGEPTIPRMKLSLVFDDGFGIDANVSQVSQRLVWRCLERRDDAPANADPATQPEHFFPVHFTVQHEQHPGHPISQSPAEIPYRIENPLVGPRELSFELVDAPAGRLCIYDGLVEFDDGTPPARFGPITTELLTAGRHFDHGFAATRDAAGAATVRPQFAGTPGTAEGRCAW
jgi:hypothetical protein